MKFYGDDHLYAGALYAGGGAAGTRHSVPDRQSHTKFEGPGVRPNATACDAVSQLARTVALGDLDASLPQGGNTD